MDDKTLTEYNEGEKFEPTTLAELLNAPCTAIENIPMGIEFQVKHAGQTIKLSKCPIEVRSSNEVHCKFKCELGETMYSAVSIGFLKFTTRNSDNVRIQHEQENGKTNYYLYIKFPQLDSDKN